jgi:hypothetical protein
MFGKSAHSVLSAMDQNKPVDILRDGKVVATVENPDAVMARVHRMTPFSLDWAWKYEGFSFSQEG